MVAKRRLLYAVFWAPGVLALVRLAVTVWFFIQNPLGLPLRFFQLIPLIAVLVATFSYFKLYSDGVPVITVIAPTLLHAILIYVFQKRIIIIPFIVLVVIDGLFLGIKGLKSNMYPFDIEGDDDEDDLLDLEDELG